MTPEQIRARGLFAIRALDTIEASIAQDDRPRDQAQRRERVAQAVRIYTAAMVAESAGVNPSPVTNDGSGNFTLR